MSTIVRAIVWGCVVASATASVTAADDGRRAVNVPRYGISVRVPQGWRLIVWGQDDRAFSLKLPQDAGSKTGYVTCRLGIAPDSLDDYRQAIDKNRDKSGDAPPDDEGATRSLVDNKIEPLDVTRFGKERAEKLGSRLITSWKTESVSGDWTYETSTRVIHDGLLYTFSLASDESHFDAYLLDFEDMLTSAVFTAPEIGVRKMPGGYWMQNDFRFAMRLPEDWKPAFGPNDKVLFFATGKTHSLFTDNLLVLASPPHLLNLELLRETLPEQIVKADGHADVKCQIVPQGGTAALETIIRTDRGATKIAILERRFTSGNRNYEVKFTCDADEFDKLLPELRRCLDSFLEVPDAPPPTAA